MVCPFFNIRTSADTSKGTKHSKTNSRNVFPEIRIILLLLHAVISAVSPVMMRFGLLAVKKLSFFCGEQGEQNDTSPDDRICFLAFLGTKQTQRRVAFLNACF